MVHHFCCICALFGQSVRGVLFYPVYSGVISSAPVDLNDNVFLCIFLEFGTRVSPRGLQFYGFTPLSQCICSLVFLVVFLFF